MKSVRLVPKGLPEVDPFVTAIWMLDDLEFEISIGYFDHDD